MTELHHVKGDKGARQTVVENCVSAINWWYKHSKDDNQFTEMAYRVINSAYEAAQKIAKIDRGE
jgi:hypothetical protein